MLDAKLIETSIFNVNGHSLSGPLIIGTFEKRAPGYLKNSLFGEKVEQLWGNIP